jgi:hypothetical protein
MLGVFSREMEPKVTSNIIVKVKIAWISFSLTYYRVITAYILHNNNKFK